MAQVVSQHHFTLESSSQLTRPDLKTFFQPDTNTGGTSMHQYKEAQRIRQLHIPTATGSPNFTTKCCEKDENSVSHIKSVKKQVDLETLDTISGFVSAAGEMINNNSKIYMQSFGKARIEPQTTIPQTINSIRARTEAIQEIRREVTGLEDPHLKWNSRKVPDAIIRARLGGWTSEFDMTRTKTEPAIVRRKLEDLFPNMKKKFESSEERDSLAKKYLFTSCTQDMYEGINWDKKLPSRLHAPVTTYEHGKANPIKKNEEFHPSPHVWQSDAGKAWDRVQDRKPNFNRHPVAFTAPLKRAGQIPGYSGTIGGENIIKMDDVIENFSPFTVLRNNQPKPCEPNFKPNIPGYTGQVHHFKTTQVTHYDPQGHAYTTTAAYHREMPNIGNNHKVSNLTGDLGRLQTKVPPVNPFNKVHMPTDLAINKSLDNIKQAVIIPKSISHPDFNAAKREVALKPNSTVDTS